MNLNSVSINNFRNIGSVQLQFQPGLNILHGANAQGKTSILEALYLLGHLKSFRGARNEELIKQGESQSRISAELTHQGSLRTLALEIGAEGKKPTLDGKEARTAEAFFGWLRPILFSPEEISLLKGVPAGRRALVDRAIFQSDPSFLERSQGYARVLKQRNCLLRDGASRSALDPWTEALIASGSRLRQDRRDYLQRLNPRLAQTYSEICAGQESASLAWNDEAADLAGEEQRLRRELSNSREREERLGQTLVGPHRDEPLFLVDGRALKTYGSQGQQRSFILAFKTAQLLDLEEFVGAPAVFLLDDMTSELDRHRQGHFFRFLLARKGQIILTTTEIQPLLEEGLIPDCLYRVESGQVREEHLE